jgi:hypothetical protein
MNLPDVGGTMVGTVLGGLILAGILWRNLLGWRRAQEETLLRAFLIESGGDLRAAVAVYKALARAKLPVHQDPYPVLERLQRERHIVPIDDDPDYFAITYDGRLAASESEYRAWLRGVFGG